MGWSPSPIRLQPLDEPGRDDAHRGAHSPKYFVLSAKELHSVWRKGAEKYYDAYRCKHGREFDESRGVPNVLVKDVSAFEGRWEKITSHLNDDEP